MCTTGQGTGGLPEAGRRREEVGNQAGKVVQKPVGEATYARLSLASLIDNVETLKFLS